MGFCQWAEMAAKLGFWVQKWVKSGSKRTSHHFKPFFRDFRESPLFTQFFKGSGNRFLKRALRQSRPSIKHGALCSCKDGHFASNFSPHGQSFH